MKNKLLFKYDREFNEDILLIANNHMDLENYLYKTYGFHKIEINENVVIIQEHESSLKTYALKTYGEIEWIDAI
jgi:hypothetical protein